MSTDGPPPIDPLGEAASLVQRIETSLRRRAGALAQADDAVRRAAVALVLAPGDAGLDLLFIKRAEYAGDPWSGQIALPGGRSEPDDETLWHTAARETQEETGIELLSSARLLGTLDEIHPRTPVLPPIVVRPHVALLDRRAPLTLSAEVAMAFWAPLAALQHPGATITATVLVRGGEMAVPSIRHGEFTIWGMTERILRSLFAQIG